MPSRMPSHTRITKREKRLIELFGPEKLNKDRVIEKKLALYFGDCRTQKRTFMRDVRIRENSLLFGENQENTNSVKNSRIIKKRKKS